jgi:hypothetical protein
MVASFIGVAWSSFQIQAAKRTAQTKGENWNEYLLKICAKLNFIPKTLRFI